MNESIGAASSGKAGEVKSDSAGITRQRPYGAVTAAETGNPAPDALHFRGCPARSAQPVIFTYDSIHQTDLDTFMADPYIIACTCPGYFGCLP